MAIVWPISQLLYLTLSFLQIIKTFFWLIKLRKQVYSNNSKYYQTCWLFVLKFLNYKNIKANIIFEVLLIILKKEVGLLLVLI